MAVDTKNQEIIDFYFQKVQDRIKEILAKDKKLKEDDIQKFNDLIFVQKDYEVRKDIQEYIQETAKNAVDVDVVAKEILNRFYDMVFVNHFNQDNVNDIENTLEERRLMKFEQFVKESNSNKTYYIPWSSWFDANPYDTDKMIEIVGLFIPEEPWLEDQYGWSNQPEVVCFLANENIIPKIEDKLNEEFKTQWIRINEKDW